MIQRAERQDAQRDVTPHQKCGNGADRAVAAARDDDLGTSGNRRLHRGRDFVRAVRQSNLGRSARR